MRLARGVERRLEAFVEAVAAHLFRGSLHPVELANRLVREADLAVVDGPAGTTIPNVYRLLVHPDEISDEEPLSELGHELAAALEETAAERGWRLDGPVQVTVLPNRRVSKGSLKCRRETVPGALPAWGHLLEVDGGRRIALAYNRCVVGRAVDADVRIDHPQVSRHHAVVWREAGKFWAVDLKSANGTWLHDTLLEDPGRVRPGEVIAFGPLSFTMRPR